MKGLKKVVVLCAVAGNLLVACQKEEIPVKPFDRGDVELETIEMGADYSKQIWFDLGDKKVVSTNDKDLWELAFDCADTAQNIYLNSGMAMMAAKTRYTRMEDAKADADLFFLADHPNNPDSLAFAGWLQEPAAVWLLDLGYTNDGQSRGKMFVQVAEHTEKAITVRYKKPGEKEASTAVIEKNDLYNRAYFSFTTGEQVWVEPAKTEYDICFTQYMEIFYEPEYLPYLVSGVMLNPYKTVAAVDSVTAFEKVSPEGMAGYDFSSRQDLIGYTWKTYDFDLGEYVIHPEKTYILRDHEGFYYKLHFTDFYNDAGEKGYPKMEFMRL